MSNISIPFLRRRVSSDIVHDYFHNALEKWTEVYKRNVHKWKYYDVDRFKMGVITTLLGDLYMGWPEELGEPTEEKWELLSNYLLELYSDEMVESFYSIRKKKGLN